MKLPLFLENKILELVKDLSFTTLEQAQVVLSQAYREQSFIEKTKKQFLVKDDQKLVYLITRFPAIYAVIQSIAEKFTPFKEGVKIETMLDLGAGPATCYLALKDFLHDLKVVDLIERDQAMSQLGKKLLQNDPKVNYFLEDLKNVNLSSCYDLITASYALSELSKNELECLIHLIWPKFTHYLLIIEPGTPYGFETILKVRESLIALGGYILMPCPKEMKCPMQEFSLTKQWCHFATRLERLSLQRLVKKATLSYEDEKFSYLLISKTPPLSREKRLIKSPQKHSGHVNLTVCTDEGIKQVVVSKKQENYKALRKALWGDSI